MRDVIEYVRLVVRQRDVLIEASERDGVAITLMRDDRDGRRRRDVNVGHRRIWTRRDKRHYDASEDGWTPGIRVQALLRRYKPAALDLVQRALNSADQHGRVSLARAISKVAMAHNQLYAYFADHAENRTTMIWWSDIQEPHNQALRDLAVIAPHINEAL